MQEVTMATIDEILYKPLRGMLEDLGLTASEIQAYVAPLPPQIEEGIMRAYQSARPTSTPIPTTC